MVAETAFTQWAIGTIRKAGRCEWARELEEAQGWEERFKRSGEVFSKSSRKDEEEFGPIDMATLKPFDLAGKMKHLEDPEQLSSIEKRLESLAEEIAEAGYTLGWWHQKQGEDFDLRAKFKQVLREAGITG